MGKFVIRGGVPLNGEIQVEANKNAVLPMMAACLLTDEDCYLDNVPGIVDVGIMTEILRELGAEVENIEGSCWRINCSGVKSWEPSARLVERLRGSIVLMGPLLARFGRANMHHPGGDAIGTRSIDAHLHALKALGCDFQVGDNFYSGTARQEAGDRNIFLNEASVTATENAMLFAAARPGRTVIRNAAGEPHIANLASMLTKMGVGIEGAGSNVLTVEGTAERAGSRERVWPDHIETGTFAALAAACKGTVTIRNAVAEHLDMMLFVLDQMGVNYELTDGALTVRPSELRGGVKIQTGVWPAFPTDLASVFIVLATQATGMTLIHDWMYEARMFFVDRLVQMGANIVLADPHRAVVSGPSPLRGREIPSPDIRAGISLVIAGLIAEEKSEIGLIEVIDRGYERIDERLRALGADIERVA